MTAVNRWLKVSQVFVCVCVCVELCLYACVRTLTLFDWVSRHDARSRVRFPWAQPHRIALEWRDKEKQPTHTYRSKQFYDCSRGAEPGKYTTIELIGSAVSLAVSDFVWYLDTYIIDVHRLISERRTSLLYAAHWRTIFVIDSRQWAYYRGVPIKSSRSRCDSVWLSWKIFWNWIHPIDRCRANQREKTVEKVFFIIRP